MIAPADRINIEAALRLLLREEQQIQERRLTDAEIGYRENEGIVLFRPAAEDRRPVVLVSRGVMDHRTTDPMEAIAWGAWKMALTLRSLPGRVPDADLPAEAVYETRQIEPNEDQRREGLMRAIEAAPAMRDTGVPTASDIVNAAESFAKFIAGEGEFLVEPGAE